MSAAIEEQCAGCTLRAATRRQRTQNASAPPWAEARSTRLDSCDAPGSLCEADALIEHIAGRLISDQRSIRFKLLQELYVVVGVEAHDLQRRCWLPMRATEAHAHVLLQAVRLDELICEPAHNSAEIQLRRGALSARRCCAA